VRLESSAALALNLDRVGGAELQGVLAAFAGQRVQRLVAFPC
jgi:hypothetical protein